LDDHPRLDEASARVNFMAFKNIEEQRNFQRHWVAKRRAEYIHLHGGCCGSCSSKEDLEFHHRDRSQKLNHRIWSWRRVRIETELAKCELLCRTCHGVETAKERAYYTSPHGTLTSYTNYKCRCAECRAANATYEYARRRKLSVV